MTLYIPLKSCNLEQSCEELEGTTHKDTDTEERAKGGFVLWSIVAKCRKVEH